MWDLELGLSIASIDIIFILAGLLLLLAVVSKIAGVIEVQPNQKLPAILISGLLLFVGFFLYLNPKMKLRVSCA
jgi:hypothetical protein